MKWTSGGTNGFLIAFDHCFATKNNKFNFSVEGSFGPAPGFALGPSILFDENKSSLGLTTTVYLGVFAIPFWNINYYFNPDTKTNIEFGSYLKWPILIEGTPFEK